jgi:hypothetical protein
MSQFQWVAPEVIVTALTTELNALANDGITALSAAVTNETGVPGLYQFINYEIVLSSLTPATGAFLVVLLVPTLDATNFFDAPLADLDRWSTTIVVDTATGAKRIGKENIPIPPLDFKLAVYQHVGGSLGATLNTLKYRRHNGQVV